MIVPERKRWIAARLRRIAQSISPAREWPAVAASFDELAEDLEHDTAAAKADANADVAKEKG